MDMRKKNILLAIIIGTIAVLIYLSSLAKFLFPASNP